MSKDDPSYDKLGTRVQYTSRPDSATENMVRIIDEKRKIEQMAKYNKGLERLRQGSLEMPAFLESVAPDMMHKLLTLIEETGSEKLRAELARDLLDRAGYSKINKAIVQHEKVDRNTAKSELINMIMSKVRKSPLVRVGETKEENADKIITVTPESKYRESVLPDANNPGHDDYD